MAISQTGFNIGEIRMALTIKQAIEAGITFVEGDKILFTEKQLADDPYGNNGYRLETEDQVNNINTDHQSDEMFSQTVGEFAWRDTTAKLPHTKDLRIDIILPCGDKHRILATSVPWEDDYITKWRPSLEVTTYKSKKENSLDELLSQVSEDNKHEVVDIESAIQAIKDLSEVLNDKGEKDMEETPSQYEAGTLEHCYDALRGDLTNTVNYSSDASLILCRIRDKKYYVANSFLFVSDWEKVCTIEEFNEYKLKQENPPTNEKTIWTTEMVECAVELQVGMTCMLHGKHVVVLFTGENLVLVYDQERSREFAVTYLDLKPIETRTKEHLQLDSLVEFMHENSQLTNVELSEALQENGFLKEV